MLVVRGKPGYPTEIGPYGIILASLAMILRSKARINDVPMDTGGTGDQLPV